MGRFVDLTGERYGKLTVIEYAGRKRDNKGRTKSIWKCKCDCGNYTECSIGDLRSRNKPTKSCGCLQKESWNSIITKHGKCKHRLYSVWQGMKSRCYRKKDPRYKTYGGRGITICDQWLGENGFENFYDWAIKNGWDDSKDRRSQSIDRKNNDLPYSPDNCKFSDSIEQAQHTTRSHYIEYNGEVHTISEWERITGLGTGCIEQRIMKLGWNPEKAISIPKKERRR